MAQIGAIHDTRREGPPGDIGVFQATASVIVHSFTFSGTTYFVAQRMGVRGWTLVSQGPVASTVIQAALNTARLVFIKEGNYPLTVQLAPPSGTQMFGEGYNTVLTQTVNTQDVIELPSGGNYIRISNMRLVGTGNTGTQKCGIEALGSNYCVFDNLDISNNSFPCIYMAGTYNVIYCCYGHDSYECGFEITGSGAPGYHLISNCRVERLLSGPEAFETAFVIVVSTRNMINNCIAVSCYRYSFDIRTGAHENILSNCLSATVTDVHYKITGSRNTLVGCGAFDTTGSYPGFDLAGSDNTVSGWYVYTSVNRAGGGVVITGTRNKLVGGWCRGYEYGILVGYTTGGDYTFIAHNHLVSNTKTGTYLYNNNPDRCTIIGNYLEGNDISLSGWGALDVSGTEHLLAFNYVYANGTGISNSSARSSIVGNYVLYNNRTGIINGSVGVQVLIANNYVYHNGVSSAGTYHGILVTGSRCIVTGNFSYDDGTRQEDGIHLGDGAIECLITGNFCYNGMGSGIALEANNDDCFIFGNFCSLNDDYGIEITAATCDRNWVKDNRLLGNVIGPFLDGGTDTKLASKVFQFIQGTTFISAVGNPWGWEIDADTEFALALGQLPLEVQQVVKIKVWAVGLVNPGAGNYMRAQFSAFGGGSDEIYTTETIAVVDKNNREVNFAVDDVISWLLTPADDVDIGDLLGGDSVQFKVLHEGAGGTDIETDAVFRCVEFEYV